MTLFEVLEIFSNPRDLEITIGCGEDNIYSMLICRGPGHNFKPLISSTPAFSSKEDVIKVIENILKIICEKAEEILSNEENPVTKIINPGGVIGKGADVLTSEMIERIAEDLEVKDISSTYLWGEQFQKDCVLPFWRQWFQKFKSCFA